METINSRISLLRKTLRLTRAAFGEEIGVSDSVIKNIEYDKTEPKPLMIQQICKAYNVSETWLTTGEGKMFVESSRKDQIAQFVGRTLASEEETFQKRLISALAEMSVEEWEALEKLISRLADIPDKKEQE